MTVPYLFKVLFCKVGGRKISIESYSEVIVLQPRSKGWISKMTQDYNCLHVFSVVFCGVRKGFSLNSTARSLHVRHALKHSQLAGEKNKSNKLAIEQHPR